MKGKIEKFIESYRIDLDNCSYNDCIKFLNSLIKYIESKNIDFDDNLELYLLRQSKILLSLEKVFDYVVFENIDVHSYIYRLLDLYVVNNGFIDLKGYIYDSKTIDISKLREYDGLKIYFNSINKTPLLSNEEEKRLTTLYYKTKDVGIRNKIVESNMRLVRSIARLYQNRGLSYEDLMQEGSLGLIKALDKFDPSKGCKFSTYATWWIRQSIISSIAVKSRNIRIPAYQFNGLLRYLDLKAKVADKISGVPSVSVMASYLKISEDKVKELEKLVLDTISLEQPVDENGNELELYISSESITPEEYSLDNFSKEDLHNAMKVALSKVQKRVLMYRYGFVNDRVYTLEETRILLFKEGYTNTVLSRQYISQLESSAIKKLKNYIEKRERAREYNKSSSEEQLQRFLKRKSKINNIFSYYSNFDILSSEVERAIVCLEPGDLRILHSYYGTDFYNPVIDETISKQDFYKVERVVLIEIKRIIVKNRELNDYDKVDLGKNILVKKKES